jgi:hypothetical protein
MALGKLRNILLSLIFMSCMSAVMAGDGSIDPATGDLDFTVHFTFPPTSQELDDIKVTLEQTALGICDATDGQIRVSQIRLTQSQSDADRGDFWVQALPGRSGGGFITDGSYLGTLGKHLNIFRGAILLPDVWLHEFGHHGFGLGEQYDEQRRFGGACGIGRGFEAGTIDEQNHSIMQQSGRMECVGGGNAGNRCIRSTDCPGGSCDFVLMSEMSVAGNHDLLRGDGVCPVGAPISLIELDGRLSDTNPVQFFDSTTFTDADASSSWKLSIPAIDDLGQLPASEVVLYGTRTDVSEWQISATIDDGELGGTVGDLTLIEQWTLTFNSDGSLNAISEASPEMTITGLASGASDLVISLDVGTPDPSDTAGQGTDGLVIDTGLTQVTEAHDGTAQCNASDCAQRWNSTTMRWESSHQSLVNGFLSDWETVARNYPFVTQPANLPAAAPDAGCFRAVNFAEDVTGSDQVLLVMDRSGSMAWSSKTDVTEVCGNSADDDSDGVTDEAECADSRMTFAQAAARAFVDLQTDRNVDVGLLQFDHLNNLVRPIDTLTSGNVGDYRTDIDSLTPRGQTAIGDALDSSHAEFTRVATIGRSRTAYLMTDGFNNTGADPAAAADRLEDIGVRVHAIPAGRDVDLEQLSDIAIKTSGEVHEAADITSMIGVFAELAARQQGAALALPRLDFVIAKNPQDAYERDPDLRKEQIKVTRSRSFRIPVERGAKRLTAILAGRNANMATWGVELNLVSPSGLMFGPGSPQLRVDSHYVFVDVISPEAGDWYLTAMPASPAAQHVTALAFIDNPRAKLHSDVRPRIVTAGSTAKANVSLAYLVDLDPQSVTVNGFLIDPIGNRRFVTFEPNEITGWSADISGLVINGVYRLQVEATVEPGALPMLGESIFEGPERAPIRVEPFRRFTSTSFLVVDGRDRPCQAKDCDEDTIPDELECREFPKDIDKDGIPNYRDTDSDNDQIPDAIEGLDDRDRNGVPDMCEPGPKVSQSGEPRSIPDLMKRQEKLIELLCSARSEHFLADELEMMSRELKRGINVRLLRPDHRRQVVAIVKKIDENLKKLHELVRDGRVSCRVATALLGEVIELERRLLRLLRR